MTGISDSSIRKRAGVGALTLAALGLWVVAGSCELAAVQGVDDFPSNFHVVDMGRVYRSAQPDARQLEAVVRSLGIRTVFNLRGDNTGTDWYDAERPVCERLGVQLIDVPMRAAAMPSAEVMNRVLTALREMVYPVLIHCNGGSDRTGAVCAIYRMKILGDEKPAALAELSTDYLHYRSLMPCMDRLAELFENRPDWIKQYASMASQPCE